MLFLGGGVTQRVPYLLVIASPRAFFIFPLTFFPPPSFGSINNSHYWIFSETGCLLLVSRQNPYPRTVQLILHQVVVHPFSLQIEHLLLKPIREFPVGIIRRACTEVGYYHHFPTLGLASLPSPSPSLFLFRTLNCESLGGRKLYF